MQPFFIRKIGTVTYFISYVLFHSQIYFHKIGDCPHFPAPIRVSYFYLAKKCSNAYDWLLLNSFNPVFCTNDGKAGWVLTKIGIGGSL